MDGSISYTPRICQGGASGFIAITPSSSSTASAVAFFDGAASRINMLVAGADYSNAAWSSNNVTVGTGIIAPDGTLTAQKLQETTANNFHYFEQAITRIATVSIPFRDAVFVKAAERTRVQIAFYDSGFANSANCLVDLSAGVIVASASVGNFVLNGSSIKSFGGGWYRINLDATGNTNPVIKAQIVADAGSGNAALNTSYAGTTGSGVYVWTSNFLPSAAWNLNRTFFDDFLSLSTIDVNDTRAPGFNFYTHNNWPNGSWTPISATPANSIAVSNSILTISNDVSGFGETLNTVADNGSGGYVGTAFALPAYFECSVAYDISHAVGVHNPSSWPAFWTIGTNWMTSNQPTSVEIDFLEAIPNGAGTIDCAATIHYWLTGSDNFYPPSGTNNAKLGSPTFSNQHVYSDLVLTQAVNGGFGYKICFFDGVYTGNDIAWKTGSNSNPAIDGTGALAIADTLQFPIILGCGPLSSSFSASFDYVSVYQ